ncbi:DsbA family oxidoreductase [Jatrophihabitans sp. DSM 45814]
MRNGMKVEIWSDVVCPWCYIGKRRFEQALSRFSQADQIDIEWKSFELDPSAESAGKGEKIDYVGRLAAKYGRSHTEAQQMLDSVATTAAVEGLDFNFEKAIPANTFDAHQVIQLGRVRGVQHAVEERLMKAYFTDGAAVADREVLAQLGAEAGLDPAEITASLADQRYAQAVRDDESEAAALGVSGVPFFVIDRRYGVSGAQSAELFLSALQQAMAESQPLSMVDAGSNDEGACGPDGCAV